VTNLNLCTHSIEIVFSLSGLTVCKQKYD
jgi:hypothetical protein